MDFPLLFTPIKLGPLTVKNRIATPPMLSCLASPDGFVTREMTEFYRSFARGGAGIMKFELTGMLVECNRTLPLVY